MDEVIKLRCKHLKVELFTRDGADHVGVDLFARCHDCGFTGIEFPHIECNPGEVTPELRRKVLDAFNEDAALDRIKDQSHGTSQGASE